MVGAGAPMRDLGPVDAVVLDTDGVITRTADVHAAAWARCFDEVLAQVLGPGQRPFSVEDYLAHVDGRPRSDGVREFLGSRGVVLPPGGPDDPPGALTVHAVGERKNAAFRRHLADDGVAAFDSTVDLVRRLRAAGVGVAAVSASENQSVVLRAAGLDGAFDVTVDGLEARRLGLAGKPDPALFLEGARRLGAAPGRTAVVEDARAGVEAGRRGGFSPVIGVDRAGRPGELAAAGADVVVADLVQLDLDADRHLLVEA